MDKMNDKKFQDWLNNYPVLSESDFYPPEDNRMICSGTEDIEDGDNFNDYLSEYFDICDENGIYD